jgi:hypothetical protein
MGIPKSISEFHIVEALPYVSGTADRTGAVLDMKGFRGVFAVVHFLAIAGSAVTTLKWQQDTASAFNVDPQDLLGTGISVADDDDGQIFILDLYEPVERYVRLYVDKNAAQASAESAIYYQYGARIRPTTVTVADLVTYERHVSPAEGTA